MAMDGFIAFFAVILAYALTPWSLALESGNLPTHLHWAWAAGIFSLSFLAAAHVLGRGCVPDRTGGRSVGGLAKLVPEAQGGNP